MVGDVDRVVPLVGDGVLLPVDRQQVRHAERVVDRQVGGLKGTGGGVGRQVHRQLGGRRRVRHRGEAGPIDGLQAGELVLGGGVHDAAAGVGAPALKEQPGGVDQVDRKSVV